MEKRTFKCILMLCFKCTLATVHFHLNVYLFSFYKTDSLTQFGNYVYNASHVFSENNFVVHIYLCETRSKTRLQQLLNKIWLLKWNIGSLACLRSPALLLQEARSCILWNCIITLLATANTSSIINYRPHKQQLQLCRN